MLNKLYRYKVVVLILFSLLTYFIYTSSNQLEELKSPTIRTEEKIKLLSTSFGFSIQGYDKPAGALNSAGFNAGLPEYGIPALQEVDSGMGVANPGILRKNDNSTALPSTLLIASTFSRDLAFAGGEILGSEAKDKGFNIVLAGGVNLIREPRNGRNFEYSSEDPLLSGIMTGSFVQGIQNNNVVSTIKHLALNAQETGRVVLNAVISEKNARESDLLAFEIANEIGQPGSVMTAYNKVNGVYASENDFLINQVLKKDWGYKGWVMSDWGGTHSTDKAISAGLDQQSGYEYDDAHYFGQPLVDAVRAGRVSHERIDDMFSRIITTLNKYNVFQKVKPLTAKNYEQNTIIAQKIAESGIVLLKNDGILPLKKDIKKILIIGGHADQGVLSGAGASQVIPEGSFLLKTKQGTQVFHKTSIVDALRKELPSASIIFESGDNFDKIRNTDADSIIIVANQWGRETKDHLSLSLPDKQDVLISSVAAIHDNVIVLLQTGGPVYMPWRDSVKGILEAWYSGTGGASAIANIIVGNVNPSGKLPVSFPLDSSDLPHPIIREWSTTTSSPRLPKKGFFDINYNIEGSNVGYKWFYKNNLKMLYPFGYGLSYTKFDYANFTLTQEGEKIITLSADIKNVGGNFGVDTAQVYMYGPDNSVRLVSWSNTSLAEGKTKKVTFKIDPRLLSTYDVKNKEWVMNSGEYTFCLAKFFGDCSREVYFKTKKQVMYKYN